MLTRPHPFAALVAVALAVAFVTLVLLLAGHGVHAGGAPRQP